MPNKNERENKVQPSIQSDFYSILHPVFGTPNTDGLGPKGTAILAELIQLIAIHLADERARVLEEVREIVSSEQEQYPSHEINYQEDNYQAGGNQACFNILASLSTLNPTEK